MIGQDLSEWVWSKDFQRGLTTIEAECREQRKEAEYVVAVKMGDKDTSQFQRIDSVAEHLLLHTLSGIDQIVLFVDVDYLCRWVSVYGRFGRCASQYCNLNHSLF